MGRKVTKKYYAVSNGLQIGIYTSFNRANQQINGVRGSCYKGYTTLEEAKNHMHAAGIPSPILYNDDNVRACSSDTDLDIDVYSNDTLPEDAGDPIMVLESTSVHGTNLNSQSLTPTRSISCTLCSTDSEISLRFPPASLELERFGNINAPQSCASTEPRMEVIDDSSIPQLSKTFNKDCLSKKPESMSHNSTVISDHKCSDNHSNCDITSSVQQNSPESNKTNEILANLVSQVSMLNQQIKAQHDCLVTFTSTTQKLMEEQCHLTNQLNEQQNKYALLAQTLNQYMSNHDAEKKAQRTLSDEDVKVADHLIAGQESLAVKAIDMQKQIENLQIDMTLCLNTLSNDSKSGSISPSTIADALEVTALEKASPSLSNTGTSSNVSKSQNESNMFENQRKILGRQVYPNDNKDSIPDDKSLDEEDTDILHYHSYLHNKDNEIKESTAKVRNSYHISNLPSTCDKLIFGDTILKHVNKKRIDHSGSTEIRTFQGANVEQLSNTLQLTEKVYPSMSKVCICAGSVDCYGNQITHPDQIKADFSKLVAETKRVFPNATISVTAIPPQKSTKAKANVLINKLNKSLQFFFKKSSVRFLDSQDLWSCVDGDGKVESGIHLANAHLSERGLSLFLRQVLSFMGRPRNRVRQEKPEQEHDHENDHNSIKISDLTPANNLERVSSQHVRPPFASSQHIKPPFPPSQQVKFPFPVGQFPWAWSPAYPMPYPGVPMNHPPFSCLPTFGQQNFSFNTKTPLRAPESTNDTAIWV